MRKNVGEFAINVWQGGSPVWIELTHEDKTFKFTEHELRDLEYAVKAAIDAANQVRQ